MAIDPGQGLHRPQVFAYLLKLARTGKVKAILGGPPCRTVSACRTRTPRPRPVRSEMHVVAQASAEGKVMFVKEQPRDPGEYREDDNPDVSVWRFQEWKAFAQKWNAFDPDGSRSIGTQEKETDDLITWTT